MGTLSENLTDDAFALLYGTKCSTMFPLFDETLLYGTKCSTMFPLFDETLRHLELCTIVISHIQRNPPKGFFTVNR